MGRTQNLESKSILPIDGHSLPLSTDINDEMIYNIKSRLTNIYWIQSKSSAGLVPMGLQGRGRLRQNSVSSIGK